jgi:hypothetical protein
MAAGKPAGSAGTVVGGRVTLPAVCDLNASGVEPLHEKAASS